MLYRFDKEAIFDYMRQHNLARVEVDYDGYGDDGSIEEVRTYRVYDFSMRPVVMDDEVDAWFDNAACMALESQGIDWYNNQGGQGTVIFDAEDEIARIEHNNRYEAYEYEEFFV